MSDFVAHIVKFNAQTNGRDKLCRFLQYSSKLGWWYTQSMLQNPNTTIKLQNLETSFSSTRKVLRLGKSLDLIQGALKNLEITDAVHKLALVAAKLNQSCYLLLDHYVWFTKITKTDENTKYWAKVASRFWLVTIMFNLLRNIYDIMNIYIDYQNKWQQKRENYSGRNNRNSGFISCVKDNKPVVIDSIKNACDVFLPLANLKYVNISVGLQGIFGMTSSLMAILQTWNQHLKLVPS